MNTYTASIFSIYPPFKLNGLYTTGPCSISLKRYKDKNKFHCYIASAKTKRDWMIHGHVALDKCNVSLGQQVSISP